MNFSIQPNLENDYVQILPLEINDFEGLYQVAKDKKIWEQHPYRIYFYSSEILGKRYQFFN